MSLGIKYFLTGFLPVNFPLKSLVLMRFVLVKPPKLITERNPFSSNALCRPSHREVHWFACGSDIIYAAASQCEAANCGIKHAAVNRLLNWRRPRWKGGKPGRESFMYYIKWLIPINISAAVTCVRADKSRFPLLQQLVPTLCADELISFGRKVTQFTD